jgi:alkaline phosphatase D
MFSRRSFSQGIGALSLYACLEPEARAQAIVDNEDCGVTSGSPRPDGFVIWTRVPLEFRRNANVVDVKYQVSTTQGFEARNIVASGDVQTSDAKDFTVKVPISGLSPFTTYYYRFSNARGFASVTGRAKTAPSPTAQQNVSFATVSCQAMSAGYYSAYLALVQKNVDYVIHLGDHIYERERGRDGNPDPLGNREAKTLSDYRRKYRWYLSDPAWREARRLFTWIDIWDDHEVFNDWDADDVGDDATRFTAAYQAFAEYIPIEEELRRGPGGRPVLQMFRSLQFGSLVDMIALDQRQFRDKMPCEDDFMVVTCDAARSARHTMLGTTQKNWFKDTLGASSARWRLVLNEVMLSPFYVPAPDELTARTAIDMLHGDAEAIDDYVLNLDAWDGYPAERQELMEFIGSEGIDNVVAITGDIHSAYNALLYRDPHDQRSGAVAVEVVTAAVSSWPLANSLRRAFGSDVDGAVRRRNAQFAWCDTASNGFTILRFTAAGMTTEHVAATTTTRADAASRVVRTASVASGRAAFS